jgi:signal transduction histidine kinase
VTSSPSRLRLRLTVLGVVGVVVPLLVLVAVSAWTTEEVSIATDGSMTTRQGGLSAWIPITVGLLLVPASAAAWWWAGREVRLNERLVASAAVQRTLLEDASHQLRTPLAVLRTSADVALADPDADVESLGEALRTVRDTSAHLQQLVEGLLVDAHRRHHTAHDADLLAIVARVCDTHEADAARRGVRVVLSSDGKPPPTGVDPIAVERAVDALVDNAVRYSPDGGAVQVDATSTAAGVTIAVTDQGPGIPAVDRHRVFERYWSTDGRSGIGLALVAQVGAAYGHVDIASRPGDGHGTTIALHLDAAPPA